MSWEDELKELKRRQELADGMGGEDKLKIQRDKGKLNARERIGLLLDKDSFREVGKIAGVGMYDEKGELTGFRPSNFIFGKGEIEGRPVVAAVDDFTVRGGAADASIVGKQIMAEQMANELRIPVIRVIDGTGGGGSVKSLDNPFARTYVPANPAWRFVADNMTTVPVVALALGPVAGLGAARAVTSHYSVMVKGLSQLFVAGPKVVRRLGEDVDNETLGGSKIHTRNGDIDDEVKSEEEAMQRARQFLSYLPSSVYELPSRGPAEDDPDRREESLLTAGPKDRRQVYKMRPIIEAVVDKGSFFETGKYFGRPVITGLARLDGWPVALMAGDPYHYGGGWTADAGLKATRFVELAETFHLPVVHLVDNPGFVIGVEAEKAATIRHGARALATVYQATVPWCSIIIRKVFGVAGAAHCNAERFRYRFAWPSGNWGSIPIEGGLEVAYRAELEASDDPDKLMKEIEARLNSVLSPFKTAESFLVEDIIDPRDTRPLLCEFANLAAPLRTPGKKAFGCRP
jgi:acetyl-CoA carboxylase carboxyltransferase component